MSLRRILLVIAGVTLAAGLVLVLLPESDAGWFTYAPQAEAGYVTSLTFTGGTLVPDRDLYGYVLIAMVAILGSGLLGHRLGSRRAG